MKLKRIKIPIYGFTLIVSEVESKDDASAMSRILSELKIYGELKENVLNHILGGSTDGGDTFRNMSIKKLLVILYPVQSEKIRRNILTHEMRHVVDRIMEWININDLEASAYLQGWLAERIY